MRFLLTLPFPIHISQILTQDFREPQTEKRTYIFQPITLMILQQPMLPTIMPLTEPTVPNNPLRALLAVLVRAADLLGRHAAPQRQRQVQRRVCGDVVVGEGGVGEAEVLAGVHEAEGGGGQGGAEGEEGSEVLEG